jgi:hypothetical protein
MTHNLNDIVDAGLRATRLRELQAEIRLAEHVKHTTGRAYLDAIVASKIAERRYVAAADALNVLLAKENDGEK